MVAEAAGVFVGGGKSLKTGFGDAVAFVQVSKTRSRLAKRLGVAGTLCLLQPGAGDSKSRILSQSLVAAKHFTERRVVQLTQKGQAHLHTTNVPNGRPERELNDMCGCDTAGHSVLSG
jgi:hypothetical protein